MVLGVFATCFGSVVFLGHFFIDNRKFYLQAGPAKSKIDILSNNFLNELNFELSGQISIAELGVWFS